MQQVLLCRAHHSTGALGDWRDAFAENKDLARQGARRCRPGVYAIDDVDPEDQAVIFWLITADEPAHDLARLGQDVADAGDDPLVAGAAQQDRTLADPERALELDRGMGCGDPLRAGDLGAPVVDLFIARGPAEQPPS